MVNLWLPWFNYSNHGFLVLFVVKPWLIFVREPILTPKASKTEAWSSAPSVTFMTPNVPLGVDYRSTTTFIAFSGKLLASEFDTRT